MAALVLHQETALPQPPKLERAPFYVGQQRVTGKHRLDHASPSSRRTSLTPSTMLTSFRRAAQRAVWLKPQSGAKDNRCGGAYSRHLRTRSAMSAGVSM